MVGPIHVGVSLHEKGTIDFLTWIGGLIGSVFHRTNLTFRRNKNTILHGPKKIYTPLDTRKKIMGKNK
jgi:hypothetical protein